LGDVSGRGFGFGEGPGAPGVLSPGMA